MSGAWNYNLALITGLSCRVLMKETGLHFVRYLLLGHKVGECAHYVIQHTNSRIQLYKSVYYYLVHKNPKINCQGIFGH